MALSEGSIVRKDEKLCRSVGIDLAEVTGARVPARGGDSTYRGRSESRADSVWLKPRDITTLCRIAQVQPPLFVQVSYYQASAE